MKKASGLFRFALLAALIFVLWDALGQAPGVAIYKQGKRESDYDDGIREASHKLFFGTNALKLFQVNEQLKRKSCQLDLPPANTNKLSRRDIYLLARASHLRIGWAFLLEDSDQWNVNLAGGYVITTNGAVATCYHVVQPERIIKDGCLVAADEDGNVMPVTEILAANKYSDACIVRVTGGNLKPLPLNTNVYPGDAAFCYSDPLDHRGYFSVGIVNRFYQFPGRRPFSAPVSAAFSPTRLDLSTDWAPGSSGSAVLDECGNAIGHVSTIATVSDDSISETDNTRVYGPTMIVFHEAVSAKDVLLFINK